MKKKLLIVSAISPFPQDSGGANRIKNTIKELSKNYQIYFISFKDKYYKFSNEENDNLNRWCKKTIFIDYSDNKIFGSYLSLNQPYWFSNWYSPELIIAINTLLKNEKINSIQIEFSQLLYLIDYIHNFENINSIFVSHDVSTISFFRCLKEEQKIPTKFLYFIRALEIFFYEKKYLPKYNKVVVVSKKDFFFIKKITKIKNILIIPNGIEKINFLKNKFNKNNIKLGYIGSTDHSPNKFAIIHFIKNIAPKLENNKISFTFYIAGKNNPIEIQKIINESELKQKNRIVNLGFVKNILDFYNTIDILVVPINSGSGSRIKIFEALGYGKKVISSSIGAEGIDINTKLISIAKNDFDYIIEINNWIKMKKRLNPNREKKYLTQKTWKSIFINYNKI